jgi:FkbM family methyltransferase
MNILSAIGNAIVALLPARNETIFRFCRKIVNRYTGDNNCDMRVNGERRLLRQALGAGAVVFDVGANIGDWTAEALALRPDASVHCFEPSPTTFVMLEGRKLPGNVVLNNIGLGAERGRMDLFVFADGLGANSLYDRLGTDARAQRRETVDITTLDDYCGERGIEKIDFLKIDAEGHDFAILRGARRLLSEGRITVTQFEYGGANIDARVLLKDIWHYIEEINSDYMIYKLFPTFLQHVPEYRQTLETFQYSNWVIMSAATARESGMRIA